MVRTIALVGCGAVSSAYYVPACRDLLDCRIEWFVDRDHNRAQKLATDYGQGQATSDYKEIIRKVDAAIIALPNHLHAEVTTAFLNEGRDVFCEKPIASNSEDGVKMVKAGNASHARLGVNLIRRRYNNFQIAKQLLDAGTLGKVTNVNCQEGRIFGWPISSMDLLDKKRAGGGALMDWGTHDLDLLRWLFHAELDLVSYEDDSLGGVEANCDLKLIIRSRQHKIPCRIVLGRTRILPNTIAISGEQGTLEILLDDLNSVYLRTGKSFLRMQPSEERDTPLLEKDYFARQLARFLDRTSDDYTKGTDAVKVLQFIEDCYRNRHQMRYPWEESPPKPDHSLSTPLNTILVVGASGFLGTRVVEKLSLEKAARVRAIVHRPGAAARLARLPVQFVECDVLNPEQVDKVVAGCEAIVNCASGDENTTYDVSVIGTTNLLEAATRHHVTKYVHLSSAAIHGFHHEGSEVSEASGFTGSPGAYEKGKIESETVVARYAKSVSTTILRPTLIYGPYSSSWTTEIISRIRDHRTTIINGNGLANLIYVDDVVAAIVCALEKDHPSGEAFILNNDQRKVTWAEYVQSYADTLGIIPVRSPEYNPDLRRIRSTLLMLRDSITDTARLVKSPQFLALLAQIPIVVKVGAKLIKGERRKRIENSVVTEMKIPRPNPKMLFKYEDTSKQFYRLLTCQALFSCAKAKRVLGFAPSTPIEKGVAKSIEWAKWAGHYGWQDS